MLDSLIDPEVEEEGAIVLCPYCENENEYNGEIIVHCCFCEEHFRGYWPEERYE